MLPSFLHTKRTSCHFNARLFRCPVDLHLSFPLYKMQIQVVNRIGIEELPRNTASYFLWVKRLSRIYASWLETIYCWGRFSKKSGGSKPISYYSIGKLSNRSNQVWVFTYYLIPDSFWLKQDAQGWRLSSRSNFSFIMSPTSFLLLLERL